MQKCQRNHQHRHFGRTNQQVDHLCSKPYLPGHNSLYGVAIARKKNLPRYLMHQCPTKPDLIKMKAIICHRTSWITNKQSLFGRHPTFHSFCWASIAWAYRTRSAKKHLPLQGCFLRKYQYLTDYQIVQSKMKYVGDGGMASGWSMKVGNFCSTSEAVTLDGPGRIHYVWYGWRCLDGGYTAMPPGTLSAKNWWSYGCFSPFFVGVVLSWFFIFFTRSMWTLMAKNSDTRCPTSTQCIINKNLAYLNLF